jgi:rubrerythrin
MTNAEHTPAAASAGGAGRAAEADRTAGSDRAGGADRAAEADRADEASRAADLGGDPVCWLHLVCPECGRFTAEQDAGPAAAGRCPECGAEPSG